jgi:hypothetical protein
MIHGFLITSPSVPRRFFSSQICPVLAHGGSVMADENQPAFALRFLPVCLFSIGILSFFDLSSCGTPHDFGISYAWAWNVWIPISTIHQNEVVSPRGNSHLVPSLAITHCSIFACFRCNWLHVPNSFLPPAFTKFPMACPHLYWLNVWSKWRRQNRCIWRLRLIAFREAPESDKSTDLVMSIPTSSRQVVWKWS